MSARDNAPASENRVSCVIRTLRLQQKKLIENVLDNHS